MPPEPTRNFVVPPAICPITTAVAALAMGHIVVFSNPVTVVTQSFRMLG